MLKARYAEIIILKFHLLPHLSQVELNQLGLPNKIYSIQIMNCNLNNYIINIQIIPLLIAQSCQVQLHRLLVRYDSTNIRLASIEISFCLHCYR